MHRAAVLAYPDDQGEPLCRFVLERSTGPGPTAAWLGWNPSRASHLIDDPTNGRVVHHSARAFCPRSLLGNVWGWRTPYSADLAAAVAAGRYTAKMHRANLDALAMMAAQAAIHVVAFGAAARGNMRQVAEAVDAFSLGGTRQLFCLGVTDDGLPLHPLARGKFAVRNDTDLRPWEACK